MLFMCRGCGKTSADIDRVLDGACECGCTRFQLVSEEAPQIVRRLNARETIRKDLHAWLDMNIDSMEPDRLNSLRVVFEVDKPQDAEKT